MPKSRSIHRKILGNTILGVLALATAGTVAFAVADTGKVAPGAAEYNAAHSEIPTRKPFHQTSYDEVRPALLDPAQPFTIAVIGDSTGNEPGEWVDLAMRAVAQKTGRPLIMNVWNLESTAYNPPQTLVQGKGEPLVVWNGSASGKSGLYSLDQYAKLVPEVPNLAIINHGHNITVAADAPSQISNLITRIKQVGEGKTAIGVTLQNPETGVNRERNEQVVSSIGALIKADPRLFLIDAHGAFVARGQLATDLRPDGLHPAETGSAAWAETTLKTLGF